MALFDASKLINGPDTSCACCYGKARPPYQNREPDSLSASRRAAKQRSQALGGANLLNLVLHLWRACELTTATVCFYTDSLPRLIGQSSVSKARACVRAGLASVAGQWFAPRVRPVCKP